MGYISKKQEQGKFNLLKLRKRPLATFTLKINRKNLTNQILSNEQRDVLAEKIRAYIMRGVYEVEKVPESQRSYTNLPCFDINFKNIFQNELELKRLALIDRQLENDQEEDIHINTEDAYDVETDVMNTVFMNKNIEVIKSYFGMGDSYSNIMQMNN